MPRLTDPLPDFGPNPAAHTWRCLAVEKVRYVGEGVAVDVATGQLTVHTNSLSFTSYLFMVAGTLKILPTNSTSALCPRAGASARSYSPPSDRNRRDVLARGRAAGGVLEDRVDNISNCDHHGSDRVYDVQLALMREGPCEDQDRHRG